MAASNFGEKFAALKDATQRQRGLELSSALRDAINALAALPEIDDVAVANTLLELSSPTGAGFLAVWLGARVERGKDPDRTCRPIVETFLKWSRTIETVPDDGKAAEGNRGLGEDVPEPDEEALAGMQLLGQALVAHLSRSPNQRRWIAETDQIRREFERVEHLSTGAVWVLQLLRQRSGQLVVLNIANKKGVVVCYENISNCFHLFTLLQAALGPVMPDARTVSEHLLDIARGESEENGHDEAWWHYGQAYVPEPTVAASVWGELGPDSISSIDGWQVLLLWPPILPSRSWDTSFFLPILHARPPKVEVMEVLSPSDVEAWWVRLALPSRKA